jgi:hypothetical protein
MYHTYNQQSPPESSSLLPTTIHHCHNITFTSTPSINSFPVKPSPEPKSHWLSPILPIFKDTPLFYQHLIGPTPPSLDACKDLPDEIEQKTLLACSYGSHDPSQGLSSHGWIFSSNILLSIVSGVGPVDGHPSLLSSYQAELSGILAVLYIILRVCFYYHIQQELVQCYCDNMGAVCNSYRRPIPGILPFLASDYDILHLIHNLLQLTPVQVVGSWVKGHYTGPSPEIQHDLNAEADDLATNYQHYQPHS